MPQLDFISYFSQFSNFFIGFVIFYLFWIKIGFSLYSSILKYWGKTLILVRKDIIAIQSARLKLASKREEITLRLISMIVLCSSCTKLFFTK